MARAPPGCYLLLVLGQPCAQEHKEHILAKVEEGLLSWDVESTRCDLLGLESVCASLQESSDTESELLIQHSTENLAVEVLLNPHVSTLKQCLKNLLAANVGHKHVIHAGYAFTGSGSWVLQDGSFSHDDFIDTLQDAEVQKALKRHTGSTVHVHCIPEGLWAEREGSSSKSYESLSINPASTVSVVPGSSLLLNCLDSVLKFQPLTDMMKSSPVVGNIRFNRPTLYVFPGGQGDCALFGVSGFTMLIDGGFNRKPCFWEFIRHLDRLDAIMITRLNENNVCGITNVVRRKKAGKRVYPQVGYVFCNVAEGKQSPTSPGTLGQDRDPLLVSVIQEGREFSENLQQLGLKPHRCLRDCQVEPLTLFHKVGHGTLEMYVLSPPKDSKEMKMFFQQWTSYKEHFSSRRATDDKEVPIPLSHAMSICALLVWKPADPAESITRVLLPGSAPQSKIFEGLEHLRHLEELRYRTCSQISLGIKYEERVKIKTTRKHVVKSSVAKQKAEMVRSSSPMKIAKEVEDANKIQRIRTESPVKIQISSPLRRIKKSIKKEDKKLTLSKDDVAVKKTAKLVSKKVKKRSRSKSKETRTEQKEDMSALKDEMAKIEDDGRVQSETEPLAPIEVEDHMEEVDYLKSEEEKLQLETEEHEKSRDRSPEEDKPCTEYDMKDNAAVEELEEHDTVLEPKEDDQTEKQKEEQIASENDQDEEIKIPTPTQETSSEKLKEPQMEVAELTRSEDALPEQLVEDVSKSPDGSEKQPSPEPEKVSGGKPKAKSVPKKPKTISKLAVSAKTTEAKTAVIKTRSKESEATKMVTKKDVTSEKEVKAKTIPKVAKTKVKVASIQLPSQSGTRTSTPPSKLNISTRDPNQTRLLKDTKSQITKISSKVDSKSTKISSTTEVKSKLAKDVVNKRVVESKAMAKQSELSKPKPPATLPKSPTKKPRDKIPVMSPKKKPILPTLPAKTSKPSKEKSKPKPVKRPEKTKVPTPSAPKKGTLDKESPIMPVEEDIPSRLSTSPTKSVEEEEAQDMPSSPKEDLQIESIEAEVIPSEKMEQYLASPQGEEEAVAEAEKVDEAVGDKSALFDEEIVAKEIEAVEAAVDELVDEIKDSKARSEAAGKNDFEEENAVLVEDLQRRKSGVSYEKGRSIEEVIISPDEIDARAKIQETALSIIRNSVESSTAKEIAFIKETIRQKGIVIDDYETHIFKIIFEILQTNDEPVTSEVVTSYVLTKKSEMVELICQKYGVEKDTVHPRSADITPSKEQPMSGEKDVEEKEIDLDACLSEENRKEIVTIANEIQNEIPMDNLEEEVLTALNEILKENSVLPSKEVIKEFLIEYRVEIITIIRRKYLQTQKIEKQYQAPKEATYKDSVPEQALSKEIDQSTDEVVPKTRISNLDGYLSEETKKDISMIENELKSEIPSTNLEEITEVICEVMATNSITPSRDTLQKIILEYRTIIISIIRTKHIKEQISDVEKVSDDEEEAIQVAKSPSKESAYEAEVTEVDEQQSNIEEYRDVLIQNLTEESKQEVLALEKEMKNELPQIDFDDIVQGICEILQNKSIVLKNEKEALKRYVVEYRTEIITIIRKKYLQSQKEEAEIVQEPTVSKGASEIRATAVKLTQDLESQSGESEDDNDLESQVSNMYKYLTEETREVIASLEYEMKDELPSVNTDDIIEAICVIHQSESIEPSKEKLKKFLVQYRENIVSVVRNKYVQEESESGESQPDLAPDEEESDIDVVEKTSPQEPQAKEEHEINYPNLDEYLTDDSRKEISLLEKEIKSEISLVNDEDIIRTICEVLVEKSIVASKETLHKYIIQYKTLIITIIRTKYRQGEEKETDTIPEDAVSKVVTSKDMDEAKILPTSDTVSKLSPEPEVEEKQPEIIYSSLDEYLSAEARKEISLLEKDIKNEIPSVSDEDINRAICEILEQKSIKPSKETLQKYIIMYKTLIITVIRKKYLQKEEETVTIPEAVVGREVTSRDLDETKTSLIPDSVLKLSPETEVAEKQPEFTYPSLDEYLSEEARKEISLLEKDIKNEIPSVSDEDINRAICEILEQKSIKPSKETLQKYIIQYKTLIITIIRTKYLQEDEEGQGEPETVEDEKDVSEKVTKTKATPVKEKLSPEVEEVEPAFDYQNLDEFYTVESRKDVSLLEHDIKNEISNVTVEDINSAICEILENEGLPLSKENLRKIIIEYRIEIVKIIRMKYVRKRQEEVEKEEVEKEEGHMKDTDEYIDQENDEISAKSVRSCLTSNSRQIISKLTDDISLENLSQEECENVLFEVLSTEFQKTQGSICEEMIVMYIKENWLQIINEVRQTYAFEIEKELDDQFIPDESIDDESSLKDITQLETEIVDADKESDATSKKLTSDEVVKAHLQKDSQIKPLLEEEKHVVENDELEAHSPLEVAEATTRSKPPSEVDKSFEASIRDEKEITPTEIDAEKPILADGNKLVKMTSPETAQEKKPTEKKPTDEKLENRPTDVIPEKTITLSSEMEVKSKEQDIIFKSPTDDFKEDTMKKIIDTIEEKQVSSVTKEEKTEHEVKDTKEHTISHFVLKDEKEAVLTKEPKKEDNKLETVQKEVVEEEKLQEDNVNEDFTAEKPSPAIPDSPVDKGEEKISSKESELDVKTQKEQTSPVDKDEKESLTKEPELDVEPQKEQKPSVDKGEKEIASKLPELGIEFQKELKSPVEKGGKESPSKEPGLDVEPQKHKPPVDKDEKEIASKEPVLHTEPQKKQSSPIDRGEKEITPEEPVLDVDPQKEQTSPVDKDEKEIASKEPEIDVQPQKEQTSPVDKAEKESPTKEPELDVEPPKQLKSSVDKDEKEIASKLPDLDIEFQKELKSPVEKGGKESPSKKTELFVEPKKEQKSPIDKGGKESPSKETGLDVEPQKQKPPADKDKKEIASKEPVLNVQHQKEQTSPIDNGEKEFTPEEPVLDADPQKEQTSPVHKDEKEIALKGPVLDVEPQKELKSPVDKVEKEIVSEEPLLDVEPQEEQTSPVDTSEKEIASKEPVLDSEPKKEQKSLVDKSEEENTSKTQDLDIQPQKEKTSSLDKDEKKIPLKQTETDVEPQKEQRSPLEKDEKYIPSNEPVSNVELQKDQKSPLEEEEKETASKKPDLIVEQQKEKALDKDEKEVLTKEPETNIELQKELTSPLGKDDKKAPSKEPEIDAEEKTSKSNIVTKIEDILEYSSDKISVELISEEKETVLDVKEIERPKTLTGEKFGSESCPESPEKTSPVSKESPPPVFEKMEVRKVPTEHSIIKETTLISGKVTDSSLIKKADDLKRPDESTVIEEKATKPLVDECEKPTSGDSSAMSPVAPLPTSTVSESITPVKDSKLVEKVTTPESKSVFEKVSFFQSTSQKTKTSPEEKIKPSEKISPIERKITFDASPVRESEESSKDMRTDVKATTPETKSVFEKVSFFQSAVQTDQKHRPSPDKEENKTIVKSSSKVEELQALSPVKEFVAPAEETKTDKAKTPETKSVFEKVSFFQSSAQKEQKKIASPDEKKIISETSAVVKPASIEIPDKDIPSVEKKSESISDEPICEKEITTPETKSVFDKVSFFESSAKKIKTPEEKDQRVKLEKMEMLLDKTPNEKPELSIGSFKERDNLLPLHEKDVDQTPDTKTRETPGEDADETAFSTQSGEEDLLIQTELSLEQTEHLKPTEDELEKTTSKETVDIKQSLDFKEGIEVQEAICVKESVSTIKRDLFADKDALLSAEEKTIEQKVASVKNSKETIILQKDQVIISAVETDMKVEDVRDKDGDMEFQVDDKDLDLPVQMITPSPIDDSDSERSFSVEKDILKSDDQHPYEESGDKEPYTQKTMAETKTVLLTKELAPEKEEKVGVVCPKSETGKTLKDTIVKSPDDEADSHIVSDSDALAKENKTEPTPSSKAIESVTQKQGDTEETISNVEGIVGKSSRSLDMAIKSMKPVPEIHEQLDKVISEVDYDEKDSKSSDADKKSPIQGTVTSLETKLDSKIDLLEIDDARKSDDRSKDSKSTTRSSSPDVQSQESSSEDGREYVTQVADTTIKGEKLDISDVSPIAEESRDDLVDSVPEKASSYSVEQLKRLLTSESQSLILDLIAELGFINITTEECELVILETLLEIFQNKNTTPNKDNIGYYLIEYKIEIVTMIIQKYEAYVTHEKAAEVQPKADDSEDNEEIKTKEIKTESDQKHAEFLQKDLDVVRKDCLKEMKSNIPEFESLLKEFKGDFSFQSDEVENIIFETVCRELNEKKTIITVKTIIAYIIEYRTEIIKIISRRYSKKEMSPITSTQPDDHSEKLKPEKEKQIKDKSLPMAMDPNTLFLETYDDDGISPVAESVMGDEIEVHHEEDEELEFAEVVQFDQVKTLSSIPKTVAAVTTHKTVYEKAETEQAFRHVFGETVMDDEIEVLQDEESSEKVASQLPVEDEPEEIEEPDSPTKKIMYVEVEVEESVTSSTDASPDTDAPEIPYEGKYKEHLTSKVEVHMESSGVSESRTEEFEDRHGESKAATLSSTKTDVLQKPGDGIVSVTTITTKVDKDLGSVETTSKRTPSPTESDGKQTVEKSVVVPDAGEEDSTETKTVTTVTHTVIMPSEELSLQDRAPDGKIAEEFIQDSNAVKTGSTATEEITRVTQTLITSAEKVSDSEETFSSNVTEFKEQPTTESIIKDIDTKVDDTTMLTTVTKVTSKIILSDDTDLKEKASPMSPGEIHEQLTHKFEIEGDKTVQEPKFTQSITTITHTVATPSDETEDVEVEEQTDENVEEVEDGTVVTKRVTTVTRTFVMPSDETEDKRSVISSNIPESEDAAVEQTVESVEEGEDGTVLTKRITTVTRTFVMPSDETEDKSSVTSSNIPESEDAEVVEQTEENAEEGEDGTVETKRVTTVTRTVVVPFDDADFKDVVESYSKHDEPSSSPTEDDTEAKEEHIVTKTVTKTTRELVTHPDEINRKENNHLDSHIDNGLQHATESVSKDSDAEDHGSTETKTITTTVTGTSFKTLEYDDTRIDATTVFTKSSEPFEDSTSKMFTSVKSPLGTLSNVTDDLENAVSTSPSISEGKEIEKATSDALRDDSQLSTIGETVVSEEVTQFTEQEKVTSQVLDTADVGELINATEKTVKEIDTDTGDSTVTKTVTTVTHTVVKSSNLLDGIDIITSETMEKAGIDDSEETKQITPTKKSVSGHDLESKEKSPSGELSTEVEDSTIVTENVAPETCKTITDYTDGDEVGSATFSSSIKSEEKQATESSIEDSGEAEEGYTVTQTVTTVTRSLGITSEPITQTPEKDSFISKDDSSAYQTVTTVKSSVNIPEGIQGTMTPTSKIETGGVDVSAQQVRVIAHDDSAIKKTVTTVTSGKVSSPQIAEETASDTKSITQTTEKDFDVTKDDSIESKTTTTVTRTMVMPSEDQVGSSSVTRTVIKSRDDHETPETENTIDAEDESTVTKTVTTVTRTVVIQPEENLIESRDDHETRDSKDAVDAEDESTVTKTVTTVTRTVVMQPEENLIESRDDQETQETEDTIDAEDESTVAKTVTTVTRTVVMQPEENLLESRDDHETQKTEDTIDAEDECTVTKTVTTVTRTVMQPEENLIGSREDHETKETEDTIDAEDESTVTKTVTTVTRTIVMQPEENLIGSREGHVTKETEETEDTIDAEDESTVTKTVTAVTRTVVMQPEENLIGSREDHETKETEDTINAEDESTVTKTVTTVTRTVVMQPEENLLESRDDHETQETEDTNDAEDESTVTKTVTTVTRTVVTQPEENLIGSREGHVTKETEDTNDAEDESTVTKTVTTVTRTVVMQPEENLIESRDENETQETEKTIDAEDESIETKTVTTVTRTVVMQQEDITDFANKGLLCGITSEDITLQKTEEVRDKDYDNSIVTKTVTTVTRAAEPKVDTVSGISEVTYGGSGEEHTALTTEENGAVDGEDYTVTKTFTTVTRTLVMPSEDTGDMKSAHSIMSSSNNDVCNQQSSKKSATASDFTEIGEFTTVTHTDDILSAGDPSKSLTSSDGSRVSQTTKESSDATKDDCTVSKTITTTRTLLTPSKETDDSVSGTSTFAKDSTIKELEMPDKSNIVQEITTVTRRIEMPLESVSDDRSTSSERHVDSDGGYVTQTIKATSKTPDDDCTITKTITTVTKTIVVPSEDSDEAEIVTSGLSPSSKDSCIIQTIEDVSKEPGDSTTVKTVTMVTRSEEVTSTGRDESHSTISTSHVGSDLSPFIQTKEDNGTTVTTTATKETLTFVMPSEDTCDVKITSSTKDSFGTNATEEDSNACDDYTITKTITTVIRTEEMPSDGNGEGITRSYIVGNGKHTAQTEESSETTDDDCTVTKTVTTVTRTIVMPSEDIPLDDNTNLEEGDIITHSYVTYSEDTDGSSSTPSKVAESELAEQEDSDKGVGGRRLESVTTVTRTFEMPVKQESSTETILTGYIEDRDTDTAHMIKEGIASDQDDSHTLKTSEVVTKKIIMSEEDKRIYPESSSISEEKCSTQSSVDGTKSTQVGSALTKKFTTETRTTVMPSKDTEEITSFTSKDSADISGKSKIESSGENNKLEDRHTITETVTKVIRTVVMPADNVIEEHTVSASDTDGISITETDSTTTTSSPIVRTVTKISKRILLPSEETESLSSASSKIDFEDQVIGSEEIEFMENLPSEEIDSKCFTTFERITSTKDSQKEEMSEVSSTSKTETIVKKEESTGKPASTSTVDSKLKTRNFPSAEDKEEVITLFTKTSHDDDMVESVKSEFSSSSKTSEEIKHFDSKTGSVVKSSLESSKDSTDSISKETIEHQVSSSETKVLESMQEKVGSQLGDYKTAITKSSISEVSKSEDLQTETSKEEKMTKHVTKSETTQSSGESPQKQFTRSRLDSEEDGADDSPRKRKSRMVKKKIFVYHSGSESSAEDVLTEEKIKEAILKAGGKPSSSSYRRIISSGTTEDLESLAGQENVIEFIDSNTSELSESITDTQSFTKIDARSSSKSESTLDELEHIEFDPFSLITKPIEETFRRKMLEKNLSETTSESKQVTKISKEKSQEMIEEKDTDTIQSTDTKVATDAKKLVMATTTRVSSERSETQASSHSESSETLSQTAIASSTSTSGRRVPETSKSEVKDTKSFNLDEWDKPMGLPSPPEPLDFESDVSSLAKQNTTKATKQGDYTENKAEKTIDSENNVPDNTEEDTAEKFEKETESVSGKEFNEQRDNKATEHCADPVYIDLTYVPHFGDPHYCNVEFFRRVRSRYYVFSGTKPSKEVFNALLEAKQDWKDKEAKVTIIPTYETDTLGYWMAVNQEALIANNIDVAPSASRCTINLQDHETSCSAYRLEL